MSICPNLDLFKNVENVTGCYIFSYIRCLGPSLASVNLVDPVCSVGLLRHRDQLVPQTALDYKGSYGFGKGALIGLSLC